MARKLGEEKRLATLAKKTAEQKFAVCEHLAKCCIVQFACERAGVGRATYYMWRSEDEEFKKNADEAISVGRAYLNDIAFSGLLKRIQENNITMLIFWLKNNHPWFGDKIRHEHNHSHEHHLVGDGVMTPEQREQIVEALRVSGREESIRRHEFLSKIFLAEKESGSSEKDLFQEETIANEVADDNRVSNLAVDKPDTKMRKELKRNGVNIEDFLKKHNRTRNT